MKKIVTIQDQCMTMIAVLEDGTARPFDIHDRSVEELVEGLDETSPDEKIEATIWERIDRDPLDSVGDYTITVTDEPGETLEHAAYQWACEHQGFIGLYSHWLSLSADTRRLYEVGAVGISTA